jgi:hypothetical protein
MFTESDRVKIRDSLGFSAIWLQADPRLENAITSIQSISDGGVRPDNSSELAAKAICADIETLYCDMKALWKAVSVGQANKVKIDAVRGLMMLRSEGRRQVTRLSALLSTNPRRDIFSASEPNLNGDAFYTSPGSQNYQG